MRAHTEFASEALHIVIFENFVESMTSYLSKLKVTPKSISKRGVLKIYLDTI